jgi:RND family efflux transporter MFP subunit
MAALCVILPFQLRPAIAATFETFLEPARVVDISTPYRDRIETIHVRENDLVKQGDLLAELESRVLKSQLAQAELAASMHGEIDAARALVRMRKKRMAMLDELKKSGNARPQELNTAKTELSMARADLQSALDRQKLKKSKARVIAAQIEEKRLTSPIDGVVVAVYKQEAELAGGTDNQPLLTLAQLDPLHAVFHLSPDAARILEGKKQVTLSITGMDVKGSIDFVSPVIDAQSGTVTVRVIVPNPKHRLHSGERCTLTVQDPTGEQFHEQPGQQHNPAADQGQIQ